MTRLHRMNLKGPWDYEWLDGPHSVSNSTVGETEGIPNSFLLPHSRVRMPSSVEDAWGVVSGRVRFRRRFQKPTNLDPHERVHIAFDGLGGNATVTVNDSLLATLCNVTEPCSYDVTSCLGPTNILQVELLWNPLENDPSHGDQIRGGLWGAVGIEIHDASAT